MREDSAVIQKYLLSAFPLTNQCRRRAASGSGARVLLIEMILVSGLPNSLRGTVWMLDRERE